MPTLITRLGSLLAFAALFSCLAAASETPGSLADANCTTPATCGDAANRERPGMASGRLAC